MASFDEHIAQAKNNLAFLGKINNTCNDHWDWQVTVCFYVAVHLANAHISKRSNMHYRTHEAVKNALNPVHAISPNKFEESEYLAYVKLLNLSRRARYLCHDNPSNVDGAKGFFTYDVHLTKALKNLDVLLVYFESEYKITFDKSSINCMSLKPATTVYFSPVS